MERDIQEGMVVRSQDGEKLGTVTRCGDVDFVVEKGLLFHRDFLVRYDEVTEIRDREVLLSREASEEVQRQRQQRAQGQAAASRTSASGSGPREDVVPLGTFGRPQDIIVELAAEEAIPRTVVRPSGSLRIHKVVRTEMKEFRIPVRREELHIERVSVDRVSVDGAAAPRAAGAPAAGGEASLESLRDGTVFEESTVVIPLHEERVEFTRTAHVWQEVHVHKAAQEELTQVRTEVRREVAEVKESGQVAHDGPLDGLH
jgi:stress response protein YsnF